jgi:hypothetical protein
MYTYNLLNVAILYQFYVSLPYQLNVLIAVLLAQSFFVHLILLYKGEYWFRDIFQIMEQNKYGDSFLSKSIEDFREDFTVASQYLLMNRRALVDRIHSRLTSAGGDITEDFILSMNDLTLGYLLQVLNLDRISFIVTENVAINDDEDDLFEMTILEKELCITAKAFEVAETIRVHFLIDPELAFVSVRRKLLKTLIINMLSIARNNIMRLLQVDDSNVHEIVIMIKSKAGGHDVDKDDNDDAVGVLCNLSVLDTGANQIGAAETIDISQLLFNQISVLLKGDYKLSSIEGKRFKNIQSCVIPMKTVAKSKHFNSMYMGEMLSSDRVLRSALIILEKLQSEKLKEVSVERTFRSTESNDKDRITVLIYDTDKSMLHRTGRLLGMFGWRSILIHSIEEFLQFKDVNSLHLVIIDDNTNRKSIASSGIDVAMYVQMLGYPFSVVSLTSTLGQKPSSSFFTDSMSKPLVDKSVHRLKKILLSRVYDVILASNGRE